MHVLLISDCSKSMQGTSEDSIHGSIEQKITDFPLGFEGQWVARMGVPMNTVRCLGLSPTFAASGAHDPPDSVLKGLVQPLFQKNGLF